MKHEGLAPSNTIPQLSSSGLRTRSDKDKPLKSGCIFAISYCSLLITHSLYLSPFNGMSTSIFQPLTQRLICQEGGYTFAPVAGMCLAMGRAVLAVTQPWIWINSTKTLQVSADPFVCQITLAAPRWALVPNHLKLKPGMLNHPHGRILCRMVLTLGMPASLLQVPIRNTAASFHSYLLRGKGSGSLDVSFLSESFGLHRGCARMMLPSHQDIA